MKVEGYLLPPEGNDKYWGVEIPVLGIHTQGTSKKNAYYMAKDALRLMMEDFGRVGKITLHGSDGNTFAISADPLESFLAFLFSRIRMEQELTLADVAKRLHSESANTYARYEQGKSVPKVDQFERLVHAVDPDIEIVIRGRPTWTARRRAGGTKKVADPVAR